MLHNRCACLSGHQGVLYRKPWIFCRSKSGDQTLSHLRIYDIPSSRPPQINLNLKYSLINATRVPLANISISGRRTSTSLTSCAAITIWNGRNVTQPVMKCPLWWRCRGQRIPDTKFQLQVRGCVVKNPQRFHKIWRCMTSCLQMCFISFSRRCWNERKDFLFRKISKSMWS